MTAEPNSGQVRHSLIQAANTFGSLIPPFMKFLYTFNGTYFKDELRKTERNSNYTSLLLTFVNYLSVADVNKLRLLNTTTYFASIDNETVRKNKQTKAGAITDDISFFHKVNYEDILKYLRRMGNLEVSMKNNATRLHIWDKKLVSAEFKEFYES